MKLTVIVDIALLGLTVLACNHPWPPGETEKIAAQCGGFMATTGEDVTKSAEFCSCYATSAAREFSWEERQAIAAGKVTPKQHERDLKNAKRCLDAAGFDRQDEQPQDQNKDQGI